MLIPRSVALLGVGFGPLALGTLGLLSASDAPAEPAAPPVFPTWVNRMPYPMSGGGGSSGGGGTGAGPMWITFDEPSRPPVLVTEDGTEVYERQPALNLDSLLKGITAIVPYRDTAAAAAAATKAEPSIQSFASGLAGLLTIYQAVAAARKNALQSVALIIAALAQRETVVTARETAVAQEAEQLRLTQQQFAINSAAVVAPESFAFDPVDDYALPLAGLDDVPATPVVLSPTPWRAVVAGACLVGVVAIVAFTVISLARPAGKPIKKPTNKKPKRPKKRKKAKRPRARPAPRRLAA